MQNTSLVTHLPQQEQIDLGVKLWGALNVLNELYSDVTMPTTLSGCTFDSDLWVTKGGARFNFRWGEWLPDEQQYPLKLLCKIAAYVNVQVYRNTPSTVQPKIVGFINLFKDIMTDKNILIGEKNTPFKSLIELTSEDIASLALKSLNEDGKLGGASFFGLHLLTKLSTTDLKDAHFLTLGASTPWTDNGTSAHKYVKSLKQSLDIDIAITPYPPLTTESVSNIVTHAMKIIDEYYDIIIDIFDIAERHNQLNPRKRLNVPRSASKEIIQKYGEKINELLPLQFVGKSKYLTAGWYTQLQDITQSACAWIVLLTTGLRNSDLRNLTHGCCVLSKRSDLIYYLVTDIQKVHLKGYVLPVPEQTNRAIQLAEKAKVHRSGNIIFHKKSSRGSEENKLKDLYQFPEEGPFNKFLLRFGEFFDFKIETIIKDRKATAHCGRATLAGYIGTNSQAAILILKRLFGHSNMLMPDAYLHHNPLVIAERNKTILTAQEELATNMAKAIVNKKVSGTKGKQLLKGAEVIESEIRQENGANSITQMDMQVTLTGRLSELLLSRMTSNQMFAMLTPLSVVCLRSCSDTTDSPCAKQGNDAERRNKNISKALTDAMATLPNPAHCIGKYCSDALIGDPWSRSLLGCFDYYVQFLKSSKGNYNLAAEAKAFVSAYADILKDIYAEEREEGYFA
jgi:hypothetical protein